MTRARFKRLKNTRSRNSWKPFEPYGTIKCWAKENKINLMELKMSAILTIFLKIKTED